MVYAPMWPEKATSDNPAGESKTRMLVSYWLQLSGFCYVSAGLNVKLSCRNVALDNDGVKIFSRYSISALQRIS